MRKTTAIDLRGGSMRAFEEVSGILAPAFDLCRARLRQEQFGFPYDFALVLYELLEYI